ncbi:DJ-1/PfpI family protein [Tenacibaculum sp. MAR_2009_124]|uniref:DJ-1/PfpI family protein n=1 Tax=Tenacibaculum sp. MAR_2009_124 TaxID=1250059 RepID=UPI0008994F64|nr:DJ-1/PfpI family protein [Tenacibaculum sp. MAR_2009_124]SEB95709.1 DJ-1/PfpI family protein [Tenacibaculum sp. MAR_2009_124]
MKKRNVGILIFNEVEVLDFAGPFEVFGVTADINNDFFNVFTIAKTSHPVIARNGLSINPHFDFSSHPEIDILIIPGGSITRKIITEEPEILQWVNEIHRSSEITASICTGAMLLAKLDLLNNTEYTTHHDAFDFMENLVPSGSLMKGKRYVNSGKIYTSGGIAAGIDLSLHLVEKFHGKAILKKTILEMEYLPNDSDFNDWNI